jgi:hypothetical protein
MLLVAAAPRGTRRSQRGFAARRGSGGEAPTILYANLNFRSKKKWPEKDVFHSI